MRNHRNASAIVSIFGQIEEVAAEALLKNYPDQVSKIETSVFPNEMMCPEVWTNKQGVRASYALCLPRRLIPELEQRIKELRA